MALTKDPNLEGSFYGGGAPSIQEMSNPPPLELFSYRVGHSSIMLPEGESSDSLGSYSSCSSLLPFLSDPSNSSSSTYSVLGHAGAGGMMGCSPPPYDRSGLSVFYRTAAASEPWGQSSATAASLLSFEHGGGENAHEDDCAAAWMDAMDPGYQLGATSDRKRRTDSRLIREQDCLEVESRGGSSPGMKDKRKGQEQFGLIDFPAGAGATAATADGGLQESGAGAGQPRESQKRKHTDAGDMPSPKKQTTKRIKESKSSPAKDPQSIAAKNRRERISERLKILQDLVPNGTKVDLVTMLEKAISYVKFLQLQVKVLATDEFWPAQGGKAPDIGQVKEAIDAILSSQRDRNSSSKH